jgi:hypothetical protein
LCSGFLKRPLCDESMLRAEALPIAYAMVTDDLQMRAEAGRQEKCKLKQMVGKTGRPGQVACVSFS